MRSAPRPRRGPASACRYGVVTVANSSPALPGRSSTSAVMLTDVNSRLPQGQYPHPCPAEIHRNERSLPQLSLELAERLEHRGCHGLRQHVLCANLQHTRPCRPRGSQYRRKIEVVPEHDASMLVGPCHDRSVRRVRCSDGRPVYALVTRCTQRLCPTRREVHVDQDPHEEASASSTSSDRQAA